VLAGNQSSSSCTIFSQNICTDLDKTNPLLQGWDVRFVNVNNFSSMATAMDFVLSGIQLAKGTCVEMFGN
jgi:hypothetical protein